jgi:two-component system cell cycle sensor histidine kinase/response regulator CckA
MSQSLRVLIVDDNEADAILLQRFLGKSALPMVTERVAEAEGLLSALERHWDAILLDYMMPGLTAPEALRHIRARDPIVPVIVLSGAATEQTLVDVMKAGAQDYVLKSNMARLVPALEREVAEAAKRREQESLRRQLELAQRMESVGRLAGGIAHDFNNLLGIVIGHAELAARRIAPDHPATKSLHGIQDAARRASELTRQLLAFGRKQTMEPQVVDLGETVDGVSRLLQRVLGEDITIRVDTDPSLGFVRLDPVQIEQVVINLAVNARDAMAQGGTLSFRLSNASVNDAYKLYSANMAPGEYVLLQVSDTGAGMAPEVQAHIFEPFFTTKPSGQGTGLGLATVYGIVKQSGGWIWVYSEPGQGTSFSIYFPRCDQVSAPPPSSVDATSTGGWETVLLVEDQDALREVTCDVLESAGYTVLTASGAVEARKMSDAHAATIHLLISDVVMPDMAGPDLAEVLLTQRPDMRVLFLSGYNEEMAAIKKLSAAGVKYLQKPVTIQALSAAMRELLVPMAGQGDDGER